MTNDGYKQLAQARNDAQVLTSRDAANTGESSCSLFVGVSEPSAGTLSKRRKQRDDHHAMYDDVTAEITFGDSTHQITCLRAKTKERLHIKADDETLHIVVMMLRSSGCGSSIYKTRDVTLPKGVWRRGKYGYVVAKQKEGIGKKYATFKDFETACVVVDTPPVDETDNACQSSDSCSPTATTVAEPTSVGDTACADGVFMIS